MPYKVLLAENDKIAIKYLENVLQDEKKFSIYKAYDGKQALDLAKQLSPDIIIININLPLTDIMDFAHQVKKALRISQIPIIVTYTDGDEHLVMQAIENGITDIIHKPFNRLELLARVKAALSLAEAIRENIYQKERIDFHVDELNKLSLIVRKSANSVIIFSTEGELEWANEGFKRIYGYDLEEFKKRYGSNIKEASPNPDLSLKKFNEVLETKQSVSYVNSFITPSGQKKWIQTTLTPIFDGSKIDKVIAIETDITHEKEVELTLLRKNKEMEKLTQELRQANEKLKKQQQLIIEERKKTEELLDNILPHYVSNQLKNIGYAKPRSYKMATVMFTDFKGFTKACENLKPEQIVSYLHTFFSVFDDIIVEHYIEKIKTIGDAYMCVGGIPLRNRSNPFDVVLAGLKIQYYITHLDEFDLEKKLPRWQLRVGIHTGPLVAGVVGKIKYAYDVWGDTVNIAKRMESACEPGKVNISGATYEKIKDYFDCEYRGKVEVKNRGAIDMYYVKGLKEEYAADETRIKPNEKFNKFYNSL